MTKKLIATVLLMGAFAAMSQSQDLPPKRPIPQPQISQSVPAVGATAKPTPAEYEMILRWQDHLLEMVCDEMQRVRISLGQRIGAGHPLCSGGMPAGKESVQAAQKICANWGSKNLRKPIWCPAPAPAFKKN